MLPFCDQDQSALRARARAWTEKWLFDRSEEDTDERARRLVRQLGQESFLNYVIAKDYGGARSQVQARDLCILREELARGDALADTMFAMQALGSYPITRAGSDEQKGRYLSRIARGNCIAAFALTEAAAGSDVASLATRAIRHGNGFQLTGTKRFISNAGIADSYIVFASTNPDLRGKGISTFIVDATTPGLIVKERTALLSPHPIGIISLDNCNVPENTLIGKEGQGLQIAFQTLDLLRCTVGAAAVGLAQRALEEAIQYGKQRRQFGQAIAEFQGTAFKLAEMATDLEAARLLVYQAAWAHDCGGDHAKQQSSMAKLYATEAAQQIVDQALQIHGANGLIAGSITEQLYRDVRALRIYEGTSEIQKLIIARELLK
ncbi:MAG: acyl-CoA dehydrogenase family protein [Candidatus Binatia bacterium]